MDPGPAPGKRGQTRRVVAPVGDFCYRPGTLDPFAIART